MKPNNPTTEAILDACQNWVDKVVIGENFCPFAKRERDRDSIRYSLASADKLEPCIQFFADELLFLDDNTDVETSLLIFPKAFDDFDDYLELLELSQEVLESIGFEGKYQLASFHPDYCFDGCNTDDPENYTNRSPYPMLHLIREESLENALKSVQSPESIPERNIAHAKKLGIETLRKLLDDCYPKA